MKNSRQHLTDAFAQLQNAQINLKHALNSVEKQNNKQNIQSTLDMVDEAVFIASNAVANYQDTEK